MACASLYESCSVSRPASLRPGWTEGTKARETIDRDPDAAFLEWAQTTGALGQERESLYHALDAPVSAQRIAGETIRTAKEETVDNDSEALNLDLSIFGGLDSVYGWLSAPAPSVAAPGRTESTRDANETIDNDRDSDALATLISLR